MPVSLMGARGAEDHSSWEKRLISLFISVWLALCGAGYWDQAEALILLEPEDERAELGVLVVGKAVVEVAGAETVEQALSMISSISNLTK